MSTTPSSFVWYELMTTDIKAAEALATEAEEMAKFHELRAKELEGK